MVNSAIAALFPHYCVLCGMRSDQALPLCERCRRCLAPNTHCCACCALPIPVSQACDQSSLCAQCLVKLPPFKRVIAPWLYDEHLAFLIQRWKFHGDRRLSAVLAALWLSGETNPSPVDVLVPVPLHWRRLWSRGFNQSELLCQQLRRGSQALGETTLGTKLVCRNRSTSSQSGLDLKDRSRNLRSAFTVNGPCDGLKIAIVDDVITTGSTASALAMCLLAGGARSVEVWCIARTPAPAN